MASDQEQKQPGNERGDETDEQLRAAIDQLLDPEAIATLRAGEVQTWEGIARRLALTSAHQVLDTPDALRQERVALWQKRFELANRKPTDQKLTDQERTKAVHLLDAAQRELYGVKHALAKRKFTPRDLHKETLHRAIAQFVAVAKREAKYETNHLNPLLRGQPWPRKKIIKEAMRIFEVDKRTVFYAIKHFPEDRCFTYTDGSGSATSATK